MTAKHTTINIFEDGTLEVTTVNSQWIKQMDKLVEEGHAEEFESPTFGRMFQCDESLFRKPYYRKPRTWTDEQKAAARERLAKAREKAKEKRTKSKPKPSNPEK